MDSPVTESDSPSISGRKLVIGLLVFAITMVAALGIYSYLDRMPFRRLERAIHAEYPNSAPRVQGGQRKMHKVTPRILRITMRVEFNPNMDPQKVDTIVERLIQLARVHQDLSSYDELEIHIFRREPGRKADTKTVKRMVPQILNPQTDNTTDTSHEKTELH